MAIAKLHAMQVMMKTVLLTSHDLTYIYGIPHIAYMTQSYCCINFELIFKDLKLTNTFSEHSILTQNLS